MKHTIVRYTLAIIGLFSVTSCTDYLDNAPDDILTFLAFARLAGILRLGLYRQNLR